MARLQEVVLVIRLISIRFVLSWERKACWLIRFTFYSHAHWGIRDKSLPTSPLQALGGVDNRTSSSKQGKFTAFTGLVIVEALPSLS